MKKYTFVIQTLVIVVIILVVKYTIDPFIFLHASGLMVSFNCIYIYIYTGTNKKSLRQGRPARTYLST